MTTNKEWLYSLTPAELTAFFDAEHDDVLHCRECAHARTDDSVVGLVCDAYVVRGVEFTVSENDYCAWGERV